MNHEFKIFIMGLIIGALLVFGIEGTLPNSSVNLYQKAIEECEKDLPRNQHCVIIGVPVDKD